MEDKKINETKDSFEIVIEKSHNRNMHIATVCQYAFKLLGSSTSQRVIKQSTFDALSRSIKESLSQLKSIKTNQDFAVANLSEGLKVLSDAILIETHDSSVAFKTLELLVTQYAQILNAENTLNLEKLYSISKR